MPQLARNNQRGNAVITKLLGLLLAVIATGAVKLAAKVSPKRDVDVFPLRLWAEGRRWWHADVYTRQPGWVFIEAGGWTLEVAWKTREELAA